MIQHITVHLNVFCEESFAVILPRAVPMSGLLRFFPLLRGSRSRDFLSDRILFKRSLRISGSAQPFPHSEKEEKDFLFLMASNISASG